MSSVRLRGGELVWCGEASGLYMEGKIKAKGSVWGGRDPMAKGVGGVFMYAGGGKEIRRGLEREGRSA